MTNEFVFAIRAKLDLTAERMLACRPTPMAAEQILLLIIDNTCMCHSV